jgi:alpha-1,2-rhamnosyltransferase
LRQHEEKGRRLFWLDDASDADLRHLYRETCAAVFTAFAEGFGLPLVEAAQCGAPIIASDIPQFHELGGSDVRYFNLLDSASLADALMQALSDEKRPPCVATLTWRESTIELIGLLRSGAYQMEVSAISRDIATAGLATTT